MPRNLAISLMSFLSLWSLGASELDAQRVYQRDSDIISEDAQGRVRSLGPGFNAVPISDNRSLFIRGAQMGYGEESSCERPATKNRVVAYDLRTNNESVLFDKPLAERTVGHGGACVYEHADLSPSQSTLYIVVPCYATSGCLAVIDLPTGRVKYIPGAMDVFVIRGGPKAGDLIYMKRSWSTSHDAPYASYPYILARPDGLQIAVISNEDLVLVGGNAPAPILRAYLRGVHGRIFVQGEWVP